MPLPNFIERGNDFVLIRTIVVHMNEPVTASTSSDPGVLDEFQTELIDFWSRVPNKCFFFCLLSVWVALFQFLGNSTFGYVDTPSLFGWMLNSYLAREPDGSLSDDSLGMFVPFIVLWLLWGRRGKLTATAPGFWWPGLFLLAMAVGLHLLGYLVQQPRVSMIALFAGGYSLMGLSWGWRWLRKSIFPLFLLAFCVPLGPLLLPITFPLRLAAAGIVEFIARAILALDVVRIGTMLSNPVNHYQYEVAAACSGIRSLIGLGLVATIVAFLNYRMLRWRLVLIALAVPLAVAGNVVRLLTIVLAAEFGGQEAGDFVHSGGPGGLLSLLPYLPAMFGLAFVVRQFQEPHRPEGKAV